MNGHFPVKLKRMKKRSHPWINRDILIQMRKRDRARKTALNSNLDDDFDLYRQLRNKVANNVCRAKINYFKGQLDENTDNRKTFWKLTKKVLPPKKKKTQIDKITVEGVDLTDSKSIAKSLNLYFIQLQQGYKLLVTNTQSDNANEENINVPLESTQEIMHPNFNFQFRPTTESNKN